MAIRDLGLQHWPSQIDKVRQLHSQVLVRHGVMLVGPTGGGKTAVRTILQKALILLPMLALQDGAKDDAETKRHGVVLVMDLHLFYIIKLNKFVMLSALLNKKTLVSNYNFSNCALIKTSYNYLILIEKDIFSFKRG